MHFTCLQVMGNRGIGCSNETRMNLHKMRLQCAVHRVLSRCWLYLRVPCVWRARGESAVSLSTTENYEPQEKVLMASLCCRGFSVSLKENRLKENFQYPFSSLTCPFDRPHPRFAHAGDRRLPDSEKTPTILAMPRETLIWSIRSCDVANLKTRKEEFPHPPLLPFCLCGFHSCPK